MQLLRIRLENWRGVSSAEIQLDSAITIVEGDNEAGKSSFIEALNLLFRERDSTKKQDLKRVTPKGVDAGSQVEVEFITGPYHLTYSKTFNKRSATSLFVHKPVTQQLVGAEAHDRVLQILEETIDFSLWQAIQLEQGGEFTQVNFKNSDSLAQALDNAAGGSGAGDGESALLEKAKKEYLKYYTEKAGKETGELALLREQEKTLKETGRSITDSLQALESFVDDSARIDDGLVTLREQLPAMQLNVVQYEKQNAEVVTLQQRLKACESQLKTAELALKDVQRQKDERDVLEKEIISLKNRIDEDSKRQKELSQVFEKANKEFDASTAEREKLLNERQSVERQQRSYEASVQLRDRKENLRELEKQFKHLQASYNELNTVEAELKAIRVDDVSVNRIEKLEQARREQQIEIRGNSAEIRLQFLKDASLDDGQRKEQYSKGDEFTTHSAEKSTLTLDDYVELRITPAADNYEKSLELEKTVESLNELLSGCDVSSVGEAIAAHRKRSELVGRLREMKRSYKSLTKEQSLEDLSGVIESCKAGIVDLETALKSGAGESQTSCWQQLEALEHSLKAARDKRDLLQQQCASAKTSLDICIQSAAADEKTLTQSKDKLQALETKVSGEKLAAEHNKASDELTSAQSQYDLAKTNSDNSQSAQIELLLGNARQSLQRAQGEIRDLEIKQADVKARLDQMQSEGLYEKQQLVVAEHDDNVARLKQLDRRARAAATLWKTLCRHQRDAQLSYARPLAERVATMGKVVFGTDFSVELSESLNIVSRTLKGITVPFDDLSGGAREQLGILLRLAAAQLVSKSEGMPLILDDTLGHTDARRLETMGAILNSAAQSSQIVVMTCYPARYSYVGGAKAVKLFPSSDAMTTV